MNVGFAPGLILLARNVTAKPYIAKCDQYIKFKIRLQRAGIENIQATYPLQLVHLDYMTIELTEGSGDVHILIITYHFRRYAQALVTPQTEI